MNRRLTTAALLAATLITSLPAQEGLARGQRNDRVSRERPENRHVERSRWQRLKRMAWDFRWHMGALVVAAVGINRSWRWLNQLGQYTGPEMSKAPKGPIPMEEWKITNWRTELHGINAGAIHQALWIEGFNATGQAVRADA